jgi:hypothetical protein
MSTVARHAKLALWEVESDADRLPAYSYTPAGLTSPIPMLEHAPVHALADSAGAPAAADPTPVKP